MFEKVEIVCTSYCYNLHSKKVKPVSVSGIPSHFALKAHSLKYFKYFSSAQLLVISRVNVCLKV